MTRWNRKHLSDDAVLSGANERFASEHANLADMLADIGEVDARRLYSRAGYSSLFAWCTGRRRLTESEAFNRIDAARKARQFPAIFPMVGDGRLSLTAVLKLGPRLTAENCDELLAAAADRTKTELEELIAARFPKTEMLPMVVAMPTMSASTTEMESLTPTTRPERVPEPVAPNGFVTPPAREQVPEPVRVPVRAVTPTAAGRHLFQFMGDDALRDLLREVQDLLGNRVPQGDMAAVVSMGLELLKQKLAKDKYALTDRPRAPRPRSKTNSRHIPAHVRRAVWKRDGGRCTYVSEDGHRCESRRFLEFHHRIPFAKDGGPTVTNIGLRCRAHNQYEAELEFGRGFMDSKRASAASRSLG